MPDFSNYQKKLIQRYYNHRDQIDEQRLSELVTDLYLASGPKRKKLWETAYALLLRLNVPPDVAKHAVDSNDPVVLAAIFKDVSGGRFKK